MLIGELYRYTGEKDWYLVPILEKVRGVYIKKNETVLVLEKSKAKNHSIILFKNNKYYIIGKPYFEKVTEENAI